MKYGLCALLLSATMPFKQSHPTFFAKLNRQSKYRLSAISSLHIIVLSRSINDLFFSEFYFAAKILLPNIIAS